MSQSLSACERIIGLASTKGMVRMTTLFVNACVRGEDSRTLKLCREYLDGIEDVKEIVLSEMDISPLSARDVEYRADLQTKGLFEDPIFNLSKELAEADDIVIGAPYWDLSFPAILKVYIERCSVCDITFEYTDDARCIGKCKAASLTYITTCGGWVDGANFGYEYICGIARMFGIPDVRFIAAEGLDVVDADIDECLAPARESIRKLKNH